jgi:hypothetical protein
MMAYEPGIIRLLFQCTPHDGDARTPTPNLRRHNLAVEIDLRYQEPPTLKEKTLA